MNMNMNMNKDCETCGWGQFVAIEECPDVPSKKQRPSALYKKKHVNTLESIDEYYEREDLINDNKIKFSYQDSGMSLNMKCNTYFGLLCFTILYVPYWLCFK